jgi:hypothetical protein
LHQFNIEILKSLEFLSFDPKTGKKYDFLNSTVSRKKRIIPFAEILKNNRFSDFIQKKMEIIEDSDSEEDDNDAYIDEIDNKTKKQLTSSELEEVDKMRNYIKINVKKIRAYRKKILGNKGLVKTSQSIFTSSNPYTQRDDGDLTQFYNLYNEADTEKEKIQILKEFYRYEKENMIHKVMRSDMMPSLSSLTLPLFFCFLFYS